MHIASAKIRFALIGIINTAIDVGLFTTLSYSGLTPVFANMASTSSALIFSFFANRSYTFKSTERTTVKQILLFLAITLFGLWVIQSIIIHFGTNILNGYDLPSILVLLIPKGFATIASLVWNYFLYERFVFVKQSTQP